MTSGHLQTGTQRKTPADELCLVGPTSRSSSARGVTDPEDQCRGFTLLEVILAIAILALSLAAIGEVVRSAFGNAAQAADSIEARIVAQSVIDQLKCGVLEITNAGPMQMSDAEALGGWSVQIIVEPTTVEALEQVRVLVGRTLDPNERPACELVRWFQDPDYAAAAAAATTSSSTSTSTTSN